MKAICVDTQDYLTKDKIYNVERIYGEQILIYNDKGFYKYYKKKYFKIIN